MDIQNSVLTTMAYYETQDQVLMANQTETIKIVGIAVVVAIVFLCIVISHRMTERRQSDHRDDDELREQLRDLLEQNRKLSDKVEKLEQDKKKEARKNS